jgi:hypothetical protein
MFIHRLLYRSEAAMAGPPEEVGREVRAIVEASRRANEAAGLTGAMLLSSGVFLQVLEGPSDAVEAAFERICGDLRHKRVRLLELAVADHRAFGDWSMVFVEPPTDAGTDLCPSSEAARNATPDAASAEAAIRMMRALLPARPLPPELVPCPTGAHLR